MVLPMTMASFGIGWLHYLLYKPSLGVAFARMSINAPHTNIPTTRCHQNLDEVHMKPTSLDPPFCIYWEHIGARSLVDCRPFQATSLLPLPRLQWPALVCPNKSSVIGLKKPGWKTNMAI